MLETSSRLHTFIYAALLTVVLICASIHLSAYVATSLDPNQPSTLIFISVIVSGVLAPPASFLLAVYSHKLINVQEQLHLLATTDPLTGLLNRRAFEVFYDREIARYKRTGQPVALLVLDLDHFKFVNNAHGHAGGDIALRKLAECLRSSIRYGTDEVARWGGEEFTILLTNTGRDTAIRAALRFRRQIETLLIEHDGQTIKLTASFGITVCDEKESLEDAVARADKCLRQAKSHGRNKVVAFPELADKLQSEQAA